MDVLSAGSPASQARWDSASLSRASLVPLEITSAPPGGSPSAEEIVPFGETGDRVTLSGDPAPPPDEQGGGMDWRSLSRMMRQMRPALGAQLRAGGNATGGMMGAVMSLTSFSFQTLFSQQLKNNPGSRISKILDQLQKRFDKLSGLAPKEAQRLGILLRMLAALNPDKADEILEKISRALEKLDSLSVSAGELPAAEVPAAEVPAAVPDAPATSSQPQQPTQESFSMIHFSLDLEVTSSQEMSFAIAELRDQGIEVQSVRIESTQTFKLHIEFTAFQQQVQQSDPLVVDLSGDGVRLTGLENGARFDINADGKTEQTAFVQGNDAFLVLDRNGNGRIDNGSEMFGDQNGAVNGFEELRKYDGNRDGVIDGKDAIYASLRLLHDRNGDGRVGLREMSTLAEKGIDSLDLRYKAGQRVDDTHRNTLAERSHYLRGNGSRGALVDVWLGYRV